MTNENYAEGIEDRCKADRIYREIDSDQRIKRIINQKAKSYDKIQYENGEDILYKEEKSAKWQGPARITSIDGVKIRVIHDDMRKLFIDQE